MGWKGSPDVVSVAEIDLETLAKFAAVTDMLTLLLT